MKNSVRICLTTIKNSSFLDVQQMDVISYIICKYLEIVVAIVTIINKTLETVF